MLGHILLLELPQISKILVIMKLSIAVAIAFLANLLGAVSAIPPQVVPKDPKVSKAQAPKATKATNKPTNKPAKKPTNKPTNKPTGNPPTNKPTRKPTIKPTLSKPPEP
jgi:hypothetical protein